MFRLSHLGQAGLPSACKEKTCLRGQSADFAGHILQYVQDACANLSLDMWREDVVRLDKSAIMLILASDTQLLNMLACVPSFV